MTARGLDNYGTEAMYDTLWESSVGLSEYSNIFEPETNLS